MQDATGDRRYWPISTIHDRVDIEALRRDRNQLLAEALHRLKNGVQHWPTPEEEERFIVPERRKFRPEVALEIIAILERFITEEPQTTRPNRPDFPWKWEPRPQPLGELYLDDFFYECFGMYAAVKRQGLDRASKKDITYCTTWLREHGWRRVHKRLPDGQTVRVWRAPGRKRDAHSSTRLGCESAEEASRASSAGSKQSGDVAAVAPQVTPQKSVAPLLLHLLSLTRGSHFLPFLLLTPKTTCITTLRVKIFQMSRF
jgi:hypothetical protein